MQHVARWCDWHGSGLEHCVLREGAEGLTLEGVVAGPDAASFGASYLVRTDARFHTREVRLRFTGGPRLHLASDGMGRWTDMIGGSALAVLDGCLDVDIGVTPATNTLPIRRLGLAAGERGEILAAHVPPPQRWAAEVLPRPAHQRYTCLGGRHYRYEGLDSGFSAELEVDASGLVLEYPDAFRRLD